ncbi:MAG: 50S ribosomal protein L21 [Candidatus Magasanikbacteria bacterium CG10_big_fil_rev_8_21_14_0_10_47_10]|uniref:Large ribosomal subunit protein bL21 n=1 Tax=Candidatus Magasanikbacteria bacterium CG10_big_fil_rev_8_21_14_0_10_47_10 TaxID=1974652 RepID=A0A2H0TR01_9BACT|nr:MAG: 50S ribosomal protein L21 [Candidatus Magasanikbacteria bacterium CG10_big_fil_rev_8_21_14_0_10_47_10]
MIAVIETGGKQYLVQEGQKLTIEKIEAEPGTEYVFDKVLLTANDDGSDVKIGAPYLGGVTLKAAVETQGRSKKLRVVKFHRKVRYTRTHGHRQDQTQVTIGAIA